METKKNKRVTWIDVTKPTSTDIAWLEKKFELHPVIVDELREPSARARVEIYEDYLYFIYYFPLYDTKDEASVRSEIDFIVTKDTIATVHYEPLKKTLDDFKIGSEANSLELLCHLLEHLITFEERQLRHIREKVEEVGRDIFKGKEKELLERITYLKRDISEYRISVRLQEPVLKSLSIKGRSFWGRDAETYLDELIGEQLKVVSQIQDYREAISDFENTNNQLMDVKINNVMRTLTSLSFFTLPFMLFVEIFSMDTHNTPLVDQPYGFWVVTGIVVVGMVVLIAYFRKKDWF